MSHAAIREMVHAHKHHEIIILWWWIWIANLTNNVDGSETTIGKEFGL